MDVECCVRNFTRQSLMLLIPGVVGEKTRLLHFASSWYPLTSRRENCLREINTSLQLKVSASCPKLFSSDTLQMLSRISPGLLPPVLLLRRTEQSVSEGDLQTRDILCTVSFLPFCLFTPVLNSSTGPGPRRVHTTTISLWCMVTFQETPQSFAATPQGIAGSDLIATTLPDTTVLACLITLGVPRIRFSQVTVVTH